MTMESINDYIFVISKDFDGFSLSWNMTRFIRKACLQDNTGGRQQIHAGRRDKAMSDRSPPPLPLLFPLHLPIETVKFPRPWKQDLMILPAMHNAREPVSASASVCSCRAEIERKWTLDPVRARALNRPVRHCVRLRVQTACSAPFCSMVHLSSASSGSVSYFGGFWRL